MKILTTALTFLTIIAQTAQAVPTMEEVAKSYEAHISWCTGGELSDIDEYESLINWAQCVKLYEVMDYCYSNNSYGTLARKNCLINLESELLNKVIYDN